MDEDTLIPAVRIAEQKYLQLEELVRTYTDLSESDIRLLLDVSHGLPFIGNLESGEEFAWFTVEDDGCGMEKGGGERGRGGSTLPETMSIGTN